MRCAIDGTVLWGANRYSGVERVADRVIRRLLLHAAPDEIRLFTTADWRGFEEGPVDREDAFVVRLPFPGASRARRILWQQLELPRQLRNWYADLLFCPAYVMPLLAPCPVVIFVHDLHGLQWRLTRPENLLHHRLILPATIRRASSVLTPTRAVMNELTRYRRSGGLDRVAPLGIDDRFRTPSIPSPSLHESRPLLFVGNLERRKGLSLLLAAMDQLSNRETCLLIAGKDRGARRALEREIARRNLERRVSLLGFVPDAALVDLYRTSTALVHPAIAEGFGIPPLEAMASGIPVIAVRTPAAVETLGDAALFVDPNPGALAAAIERLQHDPKLRQALGQKGIARAASYTWDRTAESVRQALQELYSRSERVPG